MSDESESSNTQTSDEVMVPDGDEPTNKPSVSKKKHKHTPVHKLNQYNRTKIMDHVMNAGSDSKSCANLVRQFKIKPDDAEKFVNEKAEAAQSHVHEECDSVCYKNINSWLEFSKDKNYHNEANYESALIMIAIADMEHHPDPKETGGVDFQKIYRFLGDVMMGNPTPELNPESKTFLGQEFENLISMANTTDGDNDARDLQKDIELKSKQIIPHLPAADKKRRKEYQSLDPMGIDKFISSTKRDQTPKPN